MAKKEGIKSRTVPVASSGPPPPNEIPAWLERVRTRHDLPQDPAKKIFLERAFEGIIEITNAIPSSTLERTAAANNNILLLFRALQNPEILPELERYEPLASPYLRGLQAQQDLLKQAGGLIPAEEVARILRISRQAVDKRRHAHKLIAIPQGNRGFGYPVCQFDRRGVVPGLEQMLATLDSNDAWTQLSFLLSPNATLDGQCPLKFLREGGVAPVLASASTFGEHGAQ